MLGSGSWSLCPLGCPSPRKLKLWLLGAEVELRQVGGQVEEPAARLRKLSTYVEIYLQRARKPKSCVEQSPFFLVCVWGLSGKGVAIEEPRARGCKKSRSGRKMWRAKVSPVPLMDDCPSYPPQSPSSPLEAHCAGLSFWSQVVKDSGQRSGEPRVALQEPPCGLWETSLGEYMGMASSAKICSTSLSAQNQIAWRSKGLLAVCPALVTWEASRP